MSRSPYRECARSSQLGLVNAEDERILTSGMREHPGPRPRDHIDAVQDISRDLVEIASHIGQLKGDANAFL